MNIATIVFAYNRYHHVKQVLHALKRNTKLPDKIYAFSDGLKSEEDREEWESTRKLLLDIDWCECQVICSKENKGLARSIVEGISFVLRDCEAVIVLEDDCVPHPLFMEYMYKCLEKYENNRQVYVVNGHTWNANVEPNGTSIYWSGRISSWGWGTWKNRWEEYVQDYKLIAQIKRDSFLEKELDIWGRDLESTLIGNVRGESDSWAVFWALLVIKKGGYCATPFYSLIENIGFDGTGVHCNKTSVYQKLRRVDDLDELVLMDKIEFPVGYELIFKKAFSWISQEKKIRLYNEILCSWLKIHQSGKSIGSYLKDRNIKNISIWGMGEICELLIRELENNVRIISIIISGNIQSVENRYNIPIINSSGISKDNQLIVVIPVYDFDLIESEIKKYTDCKIVALDNFLERCNGEYEDWLDG